MADPRLENSQPRIADDSELVTRAGAPSRQSQPAGLASPWWWGTRPGRLGVSTVILGTALGAIFTVLSGSAPGPLLATFMLAATAVAVLAVRPGAGYLIIPVPALAYMVAAIGTGLIHDRASDSSGTLLAVNAVQWIASGFIAMIAATALAIAVTAGRWLQTRRPKPPARRRRRVARRIS